MVAAFKQWRVYMEGAAHPVRVFSDHKNLEYFSQARTTSRRHAMWAAALAAFDYTIIYRKGSSNGLPDALSRRYDYLPPPLPSLPILSPSPPPTWFGPPLLYPSPARCRGAGVADRSPPPCHRCSLGGGC